MDLFFVISAWLRGKCVDTSIDMDSMNNKNNTSRHKMSCGFGKY